MQHKRDIELSRRQAKGNFLFIKGNSKGKSFAVTWTKSNFNDSQHLSRKYYRIFVIIYIVLYIQV